LEFVELVVKGKATPHGVVLALELGRVSFVVSNDACLSSMVKDT
jgi:hypothetical protein